MIGKIYTITTIEKEDFIYDKRCVGYSFNLEKAKEWVMKNTLDMREQNNELVVVEEVTPGIYPLSFERVWFKWNGINFVEIPCPKLFETTINFGIG